MSWTCHTCETHNPVTSLTCEVCGWEWPAEAHWTCPDCREVHPLFQQTCTGCKAPIPREFQQNHRIRETKKTDHLTALTDGPEPSWFAPDGFTRRAFPVYRNASWMDRIIQRYGARSVGSTGAVLSSLVLTFSLFGLSEENEWLIVPAVFLVASLIGLCASFLLWIKEQEYKKHRGFIAPKGKAVSEVRFKSTETPQISVHEHPIIAVKFMDKAVFTQDEAGLITSWDLNGEGLKNDWTPRTGGVAMNTWLLHKDCVLGVNDQELRKWKWEDGLRNYESWKLNLRGEPIFLGMAPGKPLVVIGTDQQEILYKVTSLWNLGPDDSGQYFGSPEGEITAMDFTHGNFATGSDQGKIQLFGYGRNSSGKNVKPYMSFPSGQEAITTLKFLTDNDLLVVGNRKGTVYLYNTTHRGGAVEAIAEIALPGPEFAITAITETRDIGKIIVGNENGDLILWDWIGRWLLGHIPNPLLSVRALDYSLRQNLLVAAGTPNHVCLWNIGESTFFP